jgi:signal-transduction protein with cAMP-binding, CBS, and nucleotidyltransferase domain
MDIGTIYRREVLSTTPVVRLDEAARRMRIHGISSLMVVEGEKVVGILTERDLTRAIAAGEQPQQTTVGEYMTDHPIMVAPGTGVREAAAEMLELDVRHLPVGVAGDVVGMVSLRDLLTVLVEHTDL